MKLRACKVTNFASYADLEFDFSNLGLTLIYGKTGSGKSTIPDIGCWILYGTTAKDGSVDDVKSWFAASTSPTIGVLDVELPDDTITVTRIRGKATHNDLFWTEQKSSDKQIRGKDITETQKLLEKRLGVSADLYVSAAYFSEFSPTGSFFTAKAKDRRAVFEKISNLEFAAKIGQASSETRKQDKDKLGELRSESDRNGGRLQSLDAGRIDGKEQQAAWIVKQRENIAAIRLKSDNFEETKRAKIEAAEKAKKGFEKTKAEKIDSLVSSLEILDGSIRQVDFFEGQEKSLNTKLRALDKIREKKNKAQSLKAVAEANQASLLREYAKYKNPKTAVCPQCLGPTNNSNCAKHLQELDEKIAEATKESIAIGKDVTAFEEELKAEKGLKELLIEVLQGKSANDTDLALFKSKQAALKEAESAENPYVGQVLQAKAEVNGYLEQIKTEEAKANPFDAQLKKLNAEYKDALGKQADLKQAITLAEHRYASLNKLYDLSSELRGVLLHKAIKEAEANTNKVLEAYFDAEIRVEFNIEAADSLSVGIQRNGYECVYRQLSKGQRQMLKLAFVTTMMKASANRAGVHFDNLFFDEALDGLDGELKMKAFGLFEQLEADHETVVLIDHDAGFQNLFSRKYRVDMVDDSSRIELDE